MHVPKKRLQVNKLFVLGAGASFAASRRGSGDKTAPLDKDFCSRIARVAKKGKKGWKVRLAKEVLSSWKDHRSFDDFGLEQAILTQLGHIEYISEIHKRRRAWLVDRKTFLRNATHLISTILSVATESGKGLYGKFYSSFAGSMSDDKLLNRIITFNYDTLLDEHLLKVMPPKHIYFDRIQDGGEKIEKRKKSLAFEDPILIKLHGSTNWRCKRDDLTKLISKDGSDKIAELQPIWIDRKNTPPRITDLFAPCIVPPLPTKPITRIKIFQYLWGKAAEYLSTAKEIIICGYSLPPTDPLAVCLFGAIENTVLKKITIVDPDPIVHKKWSQLLRRDNLGNNPKWEFFFSFEEYLK